MELALALWRSLDYSTQYLIWLVVGVMLLLSTFVGGYLFLRRLAGHRKFRGTWYSEAQFSELIQMLYEDLHRGHRVMQHDEIELLRRWQFGTTKGLGLDRSNSYFS